MHNPDRDVSSWEKKYRLERKKKEGMELLTSADPINRDIAERDDSRRRSQRQIRRGLMLEKVTSLAVIATVRYFDFLAIHIILNLMVPHPLSIRVVPVGGL